VDYIVEHLTPNGKAGIIVPEGIIFQSGNAYKQLRKMLVEDGLWAVVSLPQGVFNPYSGVKTSILFFSNPIARQTQEILFVRVENDGFDLGAQRRPIDKNDLPKALEVIKKYKQAIQQGKKFSFTNDEQKFASVVKKEKIAEDGEYNLSANRYAGSERGFELNGAWKMVELGEVIEFLQKSKRKAGDGKSSGNYPFFTSSQIQDKWFDVADYKEEALILGTGGVASVHLSKNFTTSADVFVIKSKTKNLSNVFLYYCLKNNIDILNTGFRGVGLKHLSKEYLKQIKIPLPPIEVQQQIVAELDGYQKIIDGAKQVVENYKPTIKIDPKWKVYEVGELCDVKGGKRIPKGLNFSNSKTSHPYLRVVDFYDLGIDQKDLKYITEDVFKQIKNYTITKDDVFISIAGTIGLVGEIPENLDGANLTENAAKLIIKDKNIITRRFLIFILNTYNVKEQIKRYTNAVGVPKLALERIKKIEIPVPSIEKQRQIVEKIEAEQKIVEANKELIKLFEQKIKDKISELWGK